MVSTSTLDTAVARTLQYFGFFRHPLSAAEVWRFSATDCGEDEVRDCLDQLVADGELYCEAGHYAISGDVAALIERRTTGASRANVAIPAAARVGRFIYRFPFVRFVGISGSLSKGYADDASDFDFFIITAPNRLWIARSLLHAFKKLSFLAGQQHKFCMNYFLDEGRLELQDRNVYVATELCTMIPVAGFALYERLLAANTWFRRQLPNFSVPAVHTRAERDGFVKRLSENLMNACSPGPLNAALMRLTDSKWRKKWARRGFPEADYDQAFLTRIDISKNHQMNYQKRVLAALQAAADT